MLAATVFAIATVAFTGTAASAAPASAGTAGSVSTILYADGYGGIWVANADGSGKREVNTTDATAVTFAPDGVRYAYLPEVGNELWTASTAGGTPHRLTAAGTEVGSIAWSPNGKWIAYSRQVGNGFDIYLIPSAGGTPKRLTFEAAHNCGNDHPQWSPDSKTIVYVREDFGTPSCSGGGLIVQKLGHPGAIVVPGDAWEPSFTPAGELVYMTRCGDIPACDADAVAAWEVNADGSDPTYVAPVDDSACAGTNECLLGIVGAARNRGWVELYGYVTEDNMTYGSCFQGGYQKAGTVTHTAPNFCIPFAGVTAFDVH